jgi:DNA-binding MarR family transcriptional regulator
MTTEDGLFTPDEAQAWAALGSLLEWLPSALDQALQREAGLNHFEFTVLSMLADAPDQRLRMSELAAVSNGSPSRLSHTAAKLERADLLTRATDPDDGRSTLAALTTRGSEVVDETTPLYATIVRRLVFEPLGPEFSGQLSAIGSRIIGGLMPGHTCQAPTQWIRPALAAP